MADTPIREHSAFELLEAHAKALEALNAEQAETIERLRAALTDIRDLPLMTLTIARSRATYALRGADEPSRVCALSVSPSALQGTNSNDISTLDGTQDALRMRCSTS